MGMKHLSKRLTKTSQAATLHLAQCAASTDECDCTNHSRSWQKLEQVPRSVVEEKETLECNQRSDKDGVRERSGRERSGEVAEVGAEEEPLAQKSFD